MSTIETLGAILCIFIFLNGKAISRDVLIRAVVGYRQAAIIISKRFSYLFWNSVLKISYLLLFLYAFTIGPFSIGVLSLQIFFYFDFLWQSFLILLIYNCIFIGIPYYALNTKFFDGIIYYYYYKIFSFIYLTFYFNRILPLNFFFITILLLLIADIINYNYNKKKGKSF